MKHWKTDTDQSSFPCPHRRLAPAQLAGWAPTWRSGTRILLTSTRKQHLALRDLDERARSSLRSLVSLTQLICFLTCFTCAPAFLAGVNRRERDLWISWGFRTCRLAKIGRWTPPPRCPPVHVHSCGAALSNFCCRRRHDAKPPTRNKVARIGA